MKVNIPVLLSFLLCWPALAQEGAPTNLVTLQINVNNQLRNVVIQLNESAAPQTSANFKRMVESGYYEGLAVHRAIPNYIVQMGDPLTKDVAQKANWGTGGPDHTVPAEIGLPHTRGAVAMARLPDNRNPARLSNGSQFYVALNDIPSLDGKYTVFGQVIRGIEHLDYISELTVDTNDVPMNRIEIASANLGMGAPSKGLDLKVVSGKTGDSAKAAGEAMVGAGEKMVGALPFVGRDKEGNNVAPSYEDDGAPMPRVTTADGVPPEFDLLEDEIAASNTQPVDGPEDLESIEDFREPLPMVENPDTADIGASDDMKKKRGLPLPSFGRDKNEGEEMSFEDQSLSMEPEKEKKGIGGMLPSFGGNKEEKMQDLGGGTPIIEVEEDKKSGGLGSMLPFVGNDDEEKPLELGPRKEKNGFLGLGGKNGPSDEDLLGDEKEKKGFFGGKDKKEDEEKEKGKVGKMIDKVW